MKHIITLLAIFVTSSSFAGSVNATSAGSPPPPSPDLVAFAGTRPNKSILGGYPAVNRSMRNGHTSFTREQVIYYGPATIENYQGDYFWAIPVTYITTAKAPNYVHGQHLSDGVYVTEARALVSFGRVVHWFYEALPPTRSSMPVR